MDKLKFVIEYEIPPMRGIYHTKIWAVSEEAAIKIFNGIYTKHRIRKITQSNDNRGSDRSV